MNKKNQLPIRQPARYQWLKSEPEFDPGKHLALETPEKIWTLKEFGYTSDEINQHPFPIAITTAFRMLSHEGLEAMREVTQQLIDFSSTSDRIGNFVRGGVYRSKFLRDFCNSPEITSFIEELVGTGVIPHTMPLYQGHINLLPKETNRDVDRWHLDTVCLDYVLLLTDPKEFEGGHFQFYPCHKDEAISSLNGTGKKSIQPISMQIPDAGYAILQQGNMVVHRALQVTKGDERTTLVHSFLPENLSAKDISQLSDCSPIDPHEILFTEWARHKAFLSQRKLEHLIKHLPFTDNRELICQRLSEAIKDVQSAILEISDESEKRLVYYGNDGLTDPKF